MNDFFRFPHTPHLAWLGTGDPREDKIMSPREVTTMLTGEVRVEEKLDGANLGISMLREGEIRVQNRGGYLLDPFAGQFSRLKSWLAGHRYQIESGLDERCILFGEWCAARHSLDYDALPDWFLVFDVYDRDSGTFWGSERRNALAERLGLAVVPLMFRGRTTLAELRRLLATQKSRYRSGMMEGVVVRRETQEECLGRAKLVGADFTQSMGEHWRRRALQWNMLTQAAP